MKNEFVVFLEKLGLSWPYLVNGLIGGTIWAIYKKEKWLDAVRQIIIGGAVSGYATPVIIAKTSMSLSLTGFVSFTIGVAGLVLLDGLYGWIRKIVKKYSNAEVITVKS